MEQYIILQNFSLFTLLYLLFGSFGINADEP